MVANPDASDDLLRAEFARRAMQDGTAQRILSVKADECLRFLVQRAVAQADTAERRRKFVEERTQRAEAYRAELYQRLCFLTLLGLRPGAVCDSLARGGFAPWHQR